MHPEIEDDIEGHDDKDDILQCIRLHGTSLRALTDLAGVHVKRLLARSSILTAARGYHLLPSPIFDAPRWKRMQEMDD